MGKCRGGSIYKLLLHYGAIEIYEKKNVTFYHFHTSGNKLFVQLKYYLAHFRNELLYSSFVRSFFVLFCLFVT